FHHAAGGSRTLDGGTRHRRDRRRARTGEPEGRRRPGCVRACALHQGASQAEGRGRNDMTPTSLEDQRRLVTTLGLPIVETHISYVLLDGKHAYKVKKAVNLEFLDFTTLDARRFYCHEELTLNRRLAPSIYLGVVSIAGRPDAPVLEGEGPPLEYAVKMRQFDQEGLLSRVLARDELTSERVDEIAAEVASFPPR